MKDIRKFFGNPSSSSSSKPAEKLVKSSSNTKECKLIAEPPVNKKDRNDNLEDSAYFASSKNDNSTFKTKDKMKKEKNLEKNNLTVDAKNLSKETTVAADKKIQKLEKKHEIKDDVEFVKTLVESHVDNLKKKSPKKPSTERQNKKETENSKNKEIPNKVSFLSINFTIRVLLLVFSKLLFIIY